MLVDLTAEELKDSGISRRVLRWGLELLESGEDAFTTEDLLKRLSGDGQPCTKRTLRRDLKQLHDAGIIDLSYNRVQRVYRRTEDQRIREICKGIPWENYPEFGMEELDILERKYTGPPGEFDWRVREALISAARDGQEWKLLLKWIITRINSVEPDFSRKDEPGTGFHPFRLKDKGGKNERSNEK